MSIDLKKYEELTSLFQSKNKVMKVKTTDITVKAGSTFELPLSITKKGTTVHWFFHSKGYDIKFGIAKGKKSSDRTFIVASTLYPADAAQQGKMTFPEPGEYYMVWDNTYSWLREKTLVYSVDIVLPDLTLEERVSCSRSILRDLENMKKEIKAFESTKVEKRQELQALEKEKAQRCEELESVEKEIVVLEKKMDECDQQMLTIQGDLQKEGSEIDMLAVSAPFLLEGDRIIALLTGPDILRLSCVNRLLYDASQRDCVWRRVFQQDSREDLSVIMKNEWIYSKWLVLNPGVEMPKEIDPRIMPQKE